MSFTVLDHPQSLWKTHQYSLLGGLESFLETWPKWGIMQNGECWGLTQLEQGILEKESGLLPTALARQWKNKKWYNRKNPMGNLDELPATHPKAYGDLGGQFISPQWLEHHMIWPIGWADLKPLETDKFQQWLSL